MNLYLIKDGFARERYVLSDNINNAIELFIKYWSVNEEPTSQITEIKLLTSNIIMEND